MSDFTPRERSFLYAGLRLLRHDVPSRKSEAAELQRAAPESPWPSEAELDALSEKVMNMPVPVTAENRRYLLFDFDAGQLITTNVFDTAEDAAEHAAGLADVLVLPLSVPVAKGDQACECELPGYFCSGVPGIIAHCENGRLAPGATVERCDLCQRYPSDEAARQKLVELGLA
jgi:hypothetical protein